MRITDRNKKFQGISPFVIAGIIIILVPIFSFMTMDSIREQDSRSIEKLMGKGMFLIRTFEAGTRTGMITMRWGAARVQRLLTETAYQPEVTYMMITNSAGKILAHSDPEKVDEIYENMPDTKNLDQLQQLFHRVIQSEDGKKVFQVFKLFTPASRKFRPGRPEPPPCNPGSSPLCRGAKKNLAPECILKHDPDEDEFNNEEKEKLDWFKAHFFSHVRKLSIEDHPQFIFAGLGMEEVEALKKKHFIHSIAMGVMFFSLGCAGIVSLVAFQGYRSARTSLSRVKAFSDKVVENMPAGLITINENMMITSYNKAALNILGINNILTGRPDIKLPRGMSVMAQELKGKNKKIAREMSCTAGDESSIRLDVTGSPIRDHDGEISGYLFLFQDLTELKQLKTEIDRSRRLAAVGKLAAGVAHEIRNPLSSIKGFATYFRERYHNIDHDRQAADIMVQEVERLNRSVTQLLEFAKPISITAKHVNIREMIEHSIKLVAHDLKQKGITAETMIQISREKITTDPDRLNQILLNLYLNALQAMDRNGTLSIIASDTEDSESMVIKVCDTGKGIDEKNIDHIFDPYFTTRAEGSGLGLAMVHSAVEALGGEIGVKSEKNKGTCFYIKLKCRGEINNGGEK